MESALAKRLIQRAALDAVVEPRVNRVIEMALRLGSRSTLRHDVEARADGDPTRTAIATDERTQFDITSHQFVALFEMVNCYGH